MGFLKTKGSFCTDIFHNTLYIKCMTFALLLYDIVKHACRPSDFSQ